MSTPEPAAVDYETEAIGKRPLYPPRPVGVSIVPPGGKGRYYAFGHPTGNNCTKEDARRAVKKAMETRGGVVFHNGKFDVDVASTHMGLTPPPEDKVHDTVFLAFLTNPDRVNLKLDQLAESELRAKKWKEGALKEWILSHVPGISKKDWAAHISKAPAHLAAGRAIGDAEITARLFRKLYPQVVKRGMLAAYRREQRLMPALLESEARGIRVNISLMRRDLKLYQWLLARTDEVIRRKLRSPDLDVDKRERLADALDKAKMITQWQTSAKGKRLTNKKVINATINDKGFIALLAYRSALATSVRTFFEPWMETAEASGGYIYTQWNQVRSAGSGDPFGARTGRLSSSPNFQNIPIYTRSVLILPKLLESGYLKEIMCPELFRLFPWAHKLSFVVEMADKTKKTFNHACPLPMMKSYILPYEKDHVIIERDYSQQEFRILAHYEDGPLLAKYAANPKMDVHDAARDLIQEQTGTLLDRRPVKDVGFSLIYGMGLDELARKIDRDRATAKQLKGMYLNAMPGLKTLQDQIKEASAAGEPIVTWGGREYHCEPPSFSKKFKRWMTYEYKLINRLIQGSAADCTKEGTARYHELPQRQRHGGLFLMTVHDSTVNSVPKKHWQKADQALRRCMESVEFSVPMLTDGKWGSNLSELKKIVDVT